MAPGFVYCCLLGGCSQILQMCIWGFILNLEPSSFGGGGDKTQWYCKCSSINRYVLSKSNTLLP